MSGVSNIVAFIKDQVGETLTIAKNRKLIDVDLQTLERITNIIKSSIETSYAKASSEVVNVLKNHEKVG